jgi:hypothetical protein
MQPTNRTFKNIENGFTCRLYTSADKSQYHLIYEGQHDKIADGSEVNGFYLLAHTGGVLKINGKKQIKLQMGEFYNLKEGEKVTHIKYTGFQKFTKIK